MAAVQVLSSQKPEPFKNVEVTLEHLHEQSNFRKYGGLRAPGLVVNEKMAIMGRLPTALEIMAVYEKTLSDSKKKTPRSKTAPAR